MIPSMARTLSSLLSFSWPPLSSSFPLVITILVANVFIFLTRLTCKWEEAAQKIIAFQHALYSQAESLGVVISGCRAGPQAGATKHTSTGALLGSIAL